MLHQSAAANRRGLTQVLDPTKQMSKHPSQERLHEYDRLKRFFTLWMTHIPPYHGRDKSEPHHPLVVMERHEKELSFSKCFTGLRQAVNDCLEQGAEFPTEAIKLIDDAFTEAGAPTLSELLVQQSRKFKSILRRGKIRDETEFYLVNAALSNVDSGISDLDRVMLNNIHEAYERGV